MTSSTHATKEESGRDQSKDPSHREPTLQEDQYFKQSHPKSTTEADLDGDDARHFNSKTRVQEVQD